MKKKKDTLLYYLLLIITIIAFIFLLKIIKAYDIICYIVDLALPILLGFVFAWLLTPIYNKLNKKINPKVSILIIVLAFIFVYSLIGYFAIPVLIKKINSLLKILEIYVLKLKKLKFLKIDDSLLTMKPKEILDSCGGLFSIVLNIVLIHVFGIYILYNYEHIKKLAREKMIKKQKYKLLKLIEKIGFNMRLYIKGVVLDTLILFIITLITFCILRLKYAILLSGFISLMNIIPFIGPYIGGIPAVLVALSKSKKLAIFVVAFLFISQEIESDIVSPMIMSQCVKINPLLIVIFVTIIGKIFGVLGMIFAIPILIIIKIIYQYNLDNKISNKVLT